MHQNFNYTQSELQKSPKILVVGQKALNSKNNSNMKERH